MKIFSQKQAAHTNTDIMTTTKQQEFSVSNSQWFEHSTLKKNDGFCNDVHRALIQTMSSTQQLPFVKDGLLDLTGMPDMFPHFNLLPRSKRIRRRNFDFPPLRKI